MARRIVAIIFIFAVAAVAWLILGGIMFQRSNEFDSRLKGEVAGLWGDVQAQPAPEVEFRWWTERVVDEEVTDPVTKQTTLVKKREQVLQTQPALLAGSDIQVGLKLDQRQKGLLWYSTYAVDFAGRFRYVHDDPKSGWARIVFRFPSTQATYDDFVFTVNGASPAQLAPESEGNTKILAYQVPISTGQALDFSIAYKSRGLDSWRYSFANDVSRVRDFKLAMTTDFADIDFPEGTVSPTTKDKAGDGWKLAWEFSNLISGFDLGMEMPKRTNPGPLAAQISVFAPLSLAFFFVWLFVITVLKKVDLHPMNYLFLGAAFFSFHILFSYTVDRIPLEIAFVISSAVSVFLVVSYLRLAVGLRFAAIEAGLAQLVYLVLFSYAHFYKGWTGLIVTIGGIITLFVMMQLTGRINWSEKFAGSSAKNPMPTAAVVNPNAPR